jgi:hypothetical protein
VIGGAATLSVAFSKRVVMAILTWSAFHMCWQPSMMEFQVNISPFEHSVEHSASNFDAPTFNILAKEITTHKIYHSSKPCGEICL